MKKKQIIQWIVFVTGLLVVNTTAALLFAQLLVALVPVLGGLGALALMFIVSAGFGALMVYMTARVGSWLADRGWLL